MITEQDIKDQYASLTLEQLVAEMFRMIDAVEESDSGRVFHPTTFSSVRVVDCMRLRELLPLMRDKSQPTKDQRFHDPVMQARLNEALGKS